MVGFRFPTTGLCKVVVPSSKSLYTVSTKLCPKTTTIILVFTLSCVVMIEILDPASHLLEQLI